MTLKTDSSSCALQTVILFLMVMAGGCSSGGSAPAPRAVDGVLNLTQWDFNRDGPVELSGAYAFYWHRLLDPDDFSARPAPAKTGFIRLPGLWNGFVLDGERLGGTGFATYRLTIHLPEATPPLALKFLDMGTAFRAFVNGRGIVTVGRPGTTAETTQPHYRPQVVHLGPSPRVVELIFHVSNFNHMKGGPWEVVKLGTVAQIHRRWENRITLDLMLVGCFLIMGFYNFGLFIIRRSDPSPIYFGLFCLMIALRTLTTVERYLLHLLPNLSWEFFVKLEYLSAYLALPLFMLFLHALFRAEFHPVVLRAIVGLASFFSIIVVGAPVKIFSYTVQTYQGLMVLSAFYGIYVMTKAILQQRKGARLVLAGSVPLFFTVLNDILDANGIIHTGHFVQIGLVLFIFSHALLLYLRFSVAFETIENQRQRLQQINTAYLKEIEERTQAERALTESHERFLTVLDSIDANVYVADLEKNQVLFVNQHMKNAFGPDLIGRTCRDVFLNEPGPSGECSTEDLVDPAGQPTGVKVWEGKNPVTGRWYISYDRAIKWENDRLVRLQIATDVTPIKQAEEALRKAHALLETRVQERTAELSEANRLLKQEIDERKQAQNSFKQAYEDLKQTQAQLIQSGKLASIGELSAGVAHELNQPLTVIRSTSQILLSKLKMDKEIDAGELKKHLQPIERNTSRMMKIIKHLRVFSRQSAGEFLLHDIHRIIEDTFLLVGEQLHIHKIDVAHNFQNRLPLVRVDANQMEQVFVNLFTNARDAILEKAKQAKALDTGEKFRGKIEIRTRTNASSAPGADSESGQVEIQISDNGSGIVVDDLGRIFDPFFTTKAPGQGTGLGLSISYGIVKEHDGKIEVTTTGRAGTTIAIRLPVAGASA